MSNEYLSSHELRSLLATSDNNLMTNTANKQFIKPSDAKAWSLCLRRVWLDNRGDFKFDPIEDAFGQLIINLGLAHEHAVLQKLSSTLSVHTATSPQDTSRLINERVPVIYQAQLVDEHNGIIGFPDFLILDNSGEYRAADAKLSLNEQKDEIQVQLGVYRLLLSRLSNNKLPATVFLGDGSQALIGDEADPITLKFLTEMRQLLISDDEPVVHYSHSKCRICPYYNRCKPDFESKEELSLLYGIQGRAATGLQAAGINTITQLAGTDPATIPDVPFLKGDDNKRRAVLQAQSHLTGEVHKLRPLTLPDGHWIHFDIEDNPLTGTGAKHVYLWGFLVPSASGEDKEESYEYVWTDQNEADEQGWLQFLDQVESYKQQYADLILAHYSNHERSTIRSYAERYAMETNETVKYLLSNTGPLFDLQKPVLDCLVLPLQGYGLKDICKHKELVNFQWQDDDSGSQWSVVQFNNFLAETNTQIKAKLKTDILGYNNDDVRATRRLEQWLRANFIT